MQTHVRIFESSQFESLYVGDLLLRFVVVGKDGAFVVTAVLSSSEICYELSDLSQALTCDYIIATKKAG